MKNCFLEQLFIIKNIWNALCISEKSNNTILKIKDNCEVLFTIFKESESIEILPFCSQIIMDIDQNSLDLIYINKNIENLDIIIDKCLKSDGIIITEDIEYLENYELIFESNNFRAYQKKNIKDNFLIYEDIMKRITYTAKNNKEKSNIIGVGVFTYNHEKYIIECLDSIFSQRGDYEIKLVIIDDASSDNTAKIIDDYIMSHQRENFKVNFIKHKKNKGINENFKIILEEFKNTDYFTFCEGDDYWNSSDRINKFVKYMRNNKMISIAFNSIYILNDEEKTICKNEYNLNKNFFLTQDLIKKQYFIGNLGCCFYDSFYLKFFDNKIYELPLYDFFFNTYYSTFGLIGYIREYLSTYRKHNGSLWSKTNNEIRNKKLYKYIDEYNSFFNYIYDYEYRDFQNIIIKFSEKYLPIDLAIIDNVFPHPLSSFTYEEITSYLRDIDKSMAFSTYEFSNQLSDEILRIGIKNYKQNMPALANKITDYSEEKILKSNSKLLYFIFKSTAMHYYDLIKKTKIDFIFELYPGGGMLFDDKECDLELKKLMRLKNFKKVIVTQKPVMDYLIKKKICPKKKIQLIFGVVMNSNSKYKKESFYGEKRKTLNIVFMAHKYTKCGNDKGYDLYIETAKMLSKKYNDIMFHVIGNFDENTIDVSEIKDRITFYGPITKEKFDDFFKDKDIILSPNRPNVLKEGAFDGFPTASVTEAGLRETVMISTDELKMNNNYYLEDEMIIIKPNSDDIINKIEYLHNNPKIIKKIAQNGRKKIIKLYSYENQIKPRVKLLQNTIKEKKKW